MKIAILEQLGISQDKLNALKKPFEEKGIEFFEYEKTLDEAKLIEELNDKDAIIIANMPISKNVINSADKLKFINIAFTGVDHVDIAAAKANNIAVSNASGYSTEAVAELTIGMAIAMLRNLPQVEDRLRNLKTKAGLVGNEIKGKTVGIVGLGKIGTRTAELFNAFGAKILASSRTVHKDVPTYVGQVSLDELMKNSDIVCLHCPLNDETRGLINKEKLELMKSSAILINVARGDVVNENDLCDALEKGIIRGACVDVFSIEPPLSGNEAILKAPNTLLTPHIAFASSESMELRAEIIFDNLDAWLNGEQKNVIV